MRVTLIANRLGAIALKNHLIALSLGIATVGGTASAQPPTQGPAYIGVVEAVIDGRRVPLERNNLTLSVKSRALGFGGAKSWYYALGSHSPVRIRSSQKIYFIARVASGDIDPASLFELYSMDVTKDDRRIPYTSAGLYTSMKMRANQHLVQLQFEPSSTNFVKIQLAAPLTAGEYAFSTPDSANGFLFGVD